MFGDVAVENLSPVVRYDGEAVQHVKSYRWNGEEVHGGDGFVVVVQEGFPQFRGLRVCQLF
jgi:hypothetical protein